VRAQELKEALHAGKRVYGTLVVSPSPHVPAQLKKVGIDFVFIDTEHISLDRSQFSWMCQTFRALGITPLVRISEPDPYQATVALDGGACGVVAPYVESPEEIRALRGAVKLRPLKGGNLREILGGAPPRTPQSAEYLDTYNADHLLIINIESTPAMERLDELVQIPGIDALLIGPHDLSCSLGIPEDYHNRIFEDAVRLIVSKARRAGIGAGLHFWVGMDQQVRWARDDGLNMIIQKADLLLFVEGLKRDLVQMKTSLGDVTTDGELSLNI
jgi:4-hydroxy-2-oxoheptanedioate aldolase